MNKERALHFAALLTAHANGETLQTKWTNRADNWDDQAPENINLSSLDTERLEFRIKPKPVTRPWSKPEDVPAPICWVRQTPTDRAMLITEVSDDGVMFGYGGTGASWLWFTKYPAQYSTDRKTWHPCTVTEESK